MGKKSGKVKKMKKVAGEQLYKKYLKLEPGPRLVVRILAVNVYQIGVKKVFEAMMSGMTIDGQFIPPLRQAAITDMAGRLVQKKLIRRTNKGMVCDPELRPYVTLDVLKSKQYKQVTEKIRRLDPVPQRYGTVYYRGYDQCVRELQYVCYTGGSPDEIVTSFLGMGEHFHNSTTGRFILEDVLPAHLLQEYAVYFSPTALLTMLAQILDLSLNEGDRGREEYYHYLSAMIARHRDDRISLHLLIPLFLLRGDCRRAAECIAENTWNDETLKPAALGWLLFLQGDNDGALVRFDDSLALYKKKNNKRKASLPGYFGFFHILALIGKGDDAALQEALEHIKRLERLQDRLAEQLSAWKALVCRQLGQTFDPGQLESMLLDYYVFGGIRPLSFALACYPMIWLQPSSLDDDLVSLLEIVVEKYRAGGPLWIGVLLAEIIAAACRDMENRTRSTGEKLPFAERAKKYEQIAAQLHGRCGTVTMSDLVKPVPEYEAVLKTLINLADGDRKNSDAQGNQRLVWWFVMHEDHMYPTLEPRLQKLSKNGRWTKGRPVALKKLAEEPENYPLTDQDRAICAAIYRESDGWGYRHHTYWDFDIDQAVAALPGHPLVFLRGTTTPVQIVRGEPSLRITRTKKNIMITIDPVPQPGSKILIVRETGARYVVYAFTEQQLKMAKVVDKGIMMPRKAEPLARKAADALAASLTVQSEIGGGTTAEEVKPEVEPHVLLVPQGQGLQAEMIVRPLGKDGPSLVPGRGTENVLAEIKGKRLQTRRDLQQEDRIARDTAQCCAVLSAYDRGDFQWNLESPEDCLELLVQLKEQEQVQVEWPQGESFRLRAETGFEQLSLRMSKGVGDWFKASAKLAVDDSLVLDLRKLLDKLDQGKGRFIPLDDGSFLALTREFQRRLEDLRAYGTPSGKGVKFNPLASLALDDFFSSAGKVGGDRAWKEHQRRFEPPEVGPVPSTLQAELRPYQIDGYRWLVTLAHWGVGACLADDMGLGKTVQALAALLTMADKGPILVVAPLSVVANWQEECLRFAPSFNVLRFGPGDRKTMLDRLGPFDLVVCSYGLLPIEAELLQDVQWQAVVLDEAQAIKNRQTKRSKAARGLNARFRLITTGTPVENHLGELWTLFEFLNPGLLGSFKQFQEKFGNIGSESGDPESRDRLRRLIRPFILRRLKSEVLTELPPRTEITMRVAMSEAEKALYEAKRLQALAELESADGGSVHLQILAHIMQLRRLCCNPALVLDDHETEIPSSKLKVFGDIVRELIDNRHRALVFSQFVGHLALLREFLDREKISYQYLDGSTTATQRKKRICAFQGGDGDVFLISLKAGGSGLNLTAADYVIHMDPWWNPAVEDQASDRAHRIGQQRPVTIYRLVMEGTIEEQIVELHARKRDLANSLLEGADVSGRMSADELLALLREQAGSV